VADRPTEHVPEPIARSDEPTASEEPTVSQPTVSQPGHDVITTDESPTVPARRGPDALMLVVALLALAGSVGAFTGWTPGLNGFDPRWLLAVGAAVVGALLLVSGLRHRRD